MGRILGTALFCATKKQILEAQSRRVSYKCRTRTTLGLHSFFVRLANENLLKNSFVFSCPIRAINIVYTSVSVSYIIKRHPLACKLLDFSSTNVHVHVFYTLHTRTKTHSCTRKYSGCVHPSRVYIFLGIFFGRFVFAVASFCGFRGLGAQTMWRVGSEKIPRTCTQWGENGTECARKG